MQRTISSGVSETRSTRKSNQTERWVARTKTKCHHEQISAPTPCCSENQQSPPHNLLFRERNLKGGGRSWHFAKSTRPIGTIRTRLSRNFGVECTRNVVSLREWFHMSMKRGGGVPPPTNFSLLFLTFPLLLDFARTPPFPAGRGWGMKGGLPG